MERKTTSLADQLGTCDWGDCDGRTVGLRNDPDGHGWLPVCQAHFDEAPAAERATWDDVQLMDASAWTAV